MKLDSKIFDPIRVKPDEDRLTRDVHPRCEWRGCERAGLHRAPKGRGREGEYHRFCLEHVRDYNRGYNYFEGMSDEAVVAYQKSAVTGHRPTWRWSVNTWAHEQHRDHGEVCTDGFADPFALFGEDGTAAARRRPIRNAERRALATLGLDETAEAAEIKSRYKRLVKRHHPDANGGRGGSEQKLRDIIQAYTYLRSTGLC